MTVGGAVAPLTAFRRNAQRPPAVQNGEERDLTLGTQIILPLVLLDLSHLVHLHISDVHPI